MKKKKKKGYTLKKKIIIQVSALLTALLQCWTKVWLYPDHSNMREIGFWVSTFKEVVVEHPITVSSFTL